jgi:hypothetical protein
MGQGGPRGPLVDPLLGHDIEAKPYSFKVESEPCVVFVVINEMYHNKNNRWFYLGTL